jgi:adenine phosphoribosyltransferase
MTTEELKEHIRVVPDFPIKGIMFQDITTLMKDKDCLKELLDRLYEHYKDKGITKVIGIESRGYILGAALAVRLGAGFVMARKPGKLPAETLRETYAKEYGTDALEIHKDAISEDDVCLIHDDLLATGGTTAAGLRLVRKFNPRAVYISFLIDLVDCPRAANYSEGAEVFSVLEVIENPK